MVYEALNKEVLENIPPSVRRVLDIGCGDGSLGAYLKAGKNVEVTGVTYSEQEAAVARLKLDKIVTGDLTIIELKHLGEYDCIICSHILEHLYQPEIFLEKIKGNLQNDGTIIIALPNILYWKQRLKFLAGSFKYTEGGLMDKTHFRFFDFETAAALIEKSGFRIIKKKAYGSFPLPLLRKLLPHRLSQTIDRVMCKYFPGLFGFQFIFVCKL